MRSSTVDPDVASSPPAGQGALALRLRASRSLALILAVVHLGAVLCLVPSVLAPPLKGLLAALALLSAVRNVRRHARLRSPDAVVQIACTEDGQWCLHTRSGRVLAARLRPGSYVHPALVLLDFRVGPGGTRRAVVILPGMAAPPSALRRLRQRLRYPGAAG